MFRPNLLRAALVAGLAAAALATPAAAQTKSNVAAGTLTCVGSKSVSFIIGSKRTLDCTFVNTRGVHYAYEGTISRWGIDLGVTGKNMLVWSVLAPTRSVGPKDLSGTYLGVAGAVAVGVGVQGNALLGGSKNTIALQPFSGGGQTGVNLAVGVGDLHLRAL